MQIPQADAGAATIANTIASTARCERLVRMGRASLLVVPAEVLEVLADLRLGQVLVRHRQAVVLLEQRLRVGVALQHLLGAAQPALQPRLRAPLRHACEIGTELLAAADRVARKALALERQLALHRLGICLLYTSD